MTVSIRVAKQTDLREILAIERSTPELPHWAGTEYERYVTAAELPLDRILFVAEATETIVGFTAAALHPSLVHIAELESIAVVPRMRRFGIGRKLCRSVMDWSRAQGAQIVELEVRSKGTEAIALYQELGFRVVRSRSQYYANPTDDALLLSHVL